MKGIVNINKKEFAKHIKQKKIKFINVKNNKEKKGLNDQEKIQLESNISETYIFEELGENLKKVKIQFVKPAKKKTADFRVDDIYFELKTPVTSNIKSIVKTIEEAVEKQASRVVVDLYRTTVNTDDLFEMLLKTTTENKELKGIVVCDGTKYKKNIMHQYERDRKEKFFSHYKK